MNKFMLFSMLSFCTYETYPLCGADKKIEPICVTTGKAYSAEELQKVRAEFKTQVSFICAHKKGDREEYIRLYGIACRNYLYNDFIKQEVDTHLSPWFWNRL